MEGVWLWSPVARAAAALAYGGSGSPDRGRATPRPSGRGVVEGVLRASAPGRGEGCALGASCATLLLLGRRLGRRAAAGRGRGRRGG
jgi:hypothetical protein